MQEYIKGQLLSIQCTDIIEVKVRAKKSEPTIHIQLLHQVPNIFPTYHRQEKGTKVERVLAKVSPTHQFLWELDEVNVE